MKATSWCLQQDHRRTSSGRREQIAIAILSIPFAMPKNYVPGSSRSLRLRIATLRSSRKVHSILSLSEEDRREPKWQEHLEMRPGYCRKTEDSRTLRPGKHKSFLWIRAALCSMHSRRSPKSMLQQH